MIASGWVRPPPGLDTEVSQEHTKEMKSEEQTTDKVDEESLRSLEQQHADVGFPRQTVAMASELAKLTIGVSSIATVDGNVSVSRNEDTEEVIEELELVEPQLNYVKNEFTKGEVIGGMQIEIKSMKNFDVYDEIPIEDCSQEDIDKALDCTWIKQRKTATEVRCRLCVRDCVFKKQWTETMFLLAPQHWSQ